MFSVMQNSVGGNICPSFHCSWTLSMEQSANRSQTSGLVIQLLDSFHSCSGTTVQCEPLF